MIPCMTVDAASMGTAISVVKKAVGSAPEHVLFRTTKRGRLELRAMGNGCVCSVTIDAKVKEAMKFALPLDRMEALCKKRQALTFKMPQPSLLKYSSDDSAYAGELFLNDPTPIDIALPSTSRIPVAAVLQTVMPLIELKPLIPHDMLAFFHCEKGQLVAACGDNHHAVLVRAAITSPDFSLAIPVKYQKTLLSIFKGGYSALIDSACIYAIGDDIVVQLPLVDVGDVTLEKVITYMDTTASNPRLAFSVDSQSLIRSVNNIVSVYDAEQRLQLTVAKNSLTVKMESKTGKAQDQLPVLVASRTNSDPIFMNLALLQDVLSKLEKGDITVGFIETQAATFRFTSDSMSCMYVIQAMHGGA